MKNENAPFFSSIQKDFKRYRNNTAKLKSLNTILSYLQNGIPIPQQHHPHQLTGQFRDCMECHIGPDFLIIWQDETTDIVYLVRLGSHSELFD